MVAWPYKSPKTNLPIYISFTAPIIKKGKFIGVVTGDFTMDFLNQRYYFAKPMSVSQLSKFKTKVNLAPIQIENQSGTRQISLTYYIIKYITHLLNRTLFIKGFYVKS